MGTDASRIDVQEGAYPARHDTLDGVLLELFGHTTQANTFATITRVAGLVTKVECFRDAGKTDLDNECLFTYVLGLDGVNRISTLTQIFYEFDGTTEDSRVTHTFVRDVDGNLLECNSPFTTSEDTKL